MILDKLMQALGRRQYAYKQTFQGPLAEEVLRDLARFCRAHSTTFHADPRMHAVLEGRREVWLRIQQHLQIPEPHLWDLYSGSSKRGSSE